MESTVCCCTSLETGVLLRHPDPFVHMFIGNQLLKQRLLCKYALKKRRTWSKCYNVKNIANISQKKKWFPSAG